MTSSRRIRADRANARLSSGPKSVAGKTRSARNAFRHGFNVPVTLVPELAYDVETLARRICGDERDLEMLELARRVAEARIELRRARGHRHSLIETACADPNFWTKRDFAVKRATLTAWRKDPTSDPLDVDIKAFLIAPESQPTSEGDMAWGWF